MAGVKKLTVLAVDDEEEVVESLRRTLRGEPYRFVGTTSPFEARDVIDRGEADLLVADVDMPGMTGLELAAYVRQNRPEVVRILLTGDASLESALDAINRGEVHRYFTKPWRNEPLRQAIRQALERRNELRRAAEADAVLRSRERMLAALERQYPGITVATLADGVYEIDVARLRQVAADLGLPALDALLPQASAGASFADEGTTALEKEGR
jgi:two-component system probable response regulator PhcQ